MEKRRPLVAEIKRNSLDDGPGIRSVVFFKGCPLSCVWCHNPECMKPGPDLLYREDDCIGCRTCAEVCPEKAIPQDQGPPGLDREKCTLCGLCAEECPSAALTLAGRFYEPSELADLLARDKTFYDNSGGGVTLSGGEPTLFMDYAGELCRELKTRGISILVETCGDFPWPAFKEKLLPFIDRVFVDIKLLNAEAHRRFTGRDNRRILENIERLLAAPELETLVRVPLIPEITATPENLSAIRDWLRDRGVSRIALLPYNPLWLKKAKALGLRPSFNRDSWMSKEERAAAAGIFSDFRLEREI